MNQDELDKILELHKKGSQFKRREANTIPGSSTALEKR